jgi:SAM-dependent methyltransferase
MPNPTDRQRSDDQDNAAQIAYWNDRSGAIWTALQERLDALFEPLTALALQAAAPIPGERVVDVGCGCGATVLALAQRLGPTGQVLGLDVSQPMSDRARERIAAAGLTNARIILSDAATHAFEDDETDLLFSRFGIMFFADPVAAFANLRRTMRAGGRLLCAAWRPFADNPWFHVPADAARGLISPQPPAEPTAPGPFALADHDRTVGILTNAGWRDTTLMVHDVPMLLAPPGGIEAAVDTATSVGALARALAEEGPDTRLRVRQAVAEALKTYDGPNGISLTGSIWLISARA